MTGYKGDRAPEYILNELIALVGPPTRTPGLLDRRMWVNNLRLTADKWWAEAFHAGALREHGNSSRPVLICAECPKAMALLESLSAQGKPETPNDGHHRSKRVDRRPDG